MQSQQQLAAERLAIAAQSALVCERVTGVPAELTIAQWALESGWGAHAPGNNCFGIKSYPGCYGVQMLETNEFAGGTMRRLPQPFATFATLTNCFEKHARLISEGKPYRAAWQQYLVSKDLQRLIQGIAPVYATAPDYAKTLSGIVAMQRVISALALARKIPEAA